MTWVDAIPIVLILVYAALGYFTGVMRRLIGLVALYLACIAATNMGLQAGFILQQSSTYGTADARIYGFFGILFAVIIVIDGAAQLANSQIQLQAVMFNRLSGVIVGVVTGLLLSILVTYELQAAGNPFGGTAREQPDPAPGGHVQPAVRCDRRSGDRAAPLDPGHVRAPGCRQSVWRHTAGRAAAGHPRRRQWLASRGAAREGVREADRLGLPAGVAGRPTDLFRPRPRQPLKL